MPKLYAPGAMVILEKLTSVTPVNAMSTGSLCSPSESVSTATGVSDDDEHDAISAAQMEMVKALEIFIFLKLTLSSEGKRPQVRLLSGRQ